MLNFLENWLDRRSEKALLRALANWQKDPSTELGDFGLSVTTDLSSPMQTTGYVVFQFRLHHLKGGHYHSGIYRIPCGNTVSTVFDPSLALDWLPEVAGPLLNEFLLPSGISDGIQRSAKFEPLRLVEP